MTVSGYIIIFHSRETCGYLGRIPPKTFTTFNMIPVRTRTVRLWSNLPRHGGFLSHGDTPMAGWFMESPLQWMIWEFPHGKAPHDGKSRGLLRYVMLQWMSIWEGISKNIIWWISQLAIVSDIAVRHEHLWFGEWFISILCRMGPHS